MSRPFPSVAASVILRTMVRIPGALLAIGAVVGLVVLVSAVAHGDGSLMVLAACATVASGVGALRD